MPLSQSNRRSTRRPRRVEAGRIYSEGIGQCCPTKTPRHRKTRLSLSVFILASTKNPEMMTSYALASPFSN
jgi:hypothetical protein